MSEIEKRQRTVEGEKQGEARPVEGKGRVGPRGEQCPWKKGWLLAF